MIKCWDSVTNSYGTLKESVTLLNYLREGRARSRIEGLLGEQGRSPVDYIEEAWDPLGHELHWGTL